MGKKNGKRLVYNNASVMVLVTSEPIKKMPKSLDELIALRDNGKILDVSFTQDIGAANVGQGGNVPFRRAL